MPTPVAHLRASTSSLRLEEAEDEDFLAVLEPIHEAALFVEDALLYTSHSRPLKGTLLVSCMSSHCGLGPWCNLPSLSSWHFPFWSCHRGVRAT